PLKILEYLATSRALQRAVREDLEIAFREGVIHAHQPAPQPAHGRLAARLGKTMLVIELEKGHAFAMAQFSVDKAGLTKRRPGPVNVEVILGGDGHQRWPGGTQRQIIRVF